MMTHSYEFGLVKEQIKQGVGIFQCDEHAVFSQDGVVHLGHGPHGLDVSTIGFKKAWVGRSSDGTAGNSLLFMHVWEAVRKDGRYKKVDWTIKADPDAVLLPARLRTHLRQHTGPANYLVNCNLVPGNPAFPMIFGSLEAYSRPALDMYYQRNQICKNQLDWPHWGEDKYMGQCMKTLGAQEFDDFNIVGDKRCGGANCGDGQRAAYHDFKSIPEWFNCYKTATGQWR